MWKKFKVNSGHNLKSVKKTWKQRSIKQAKNSSNPGCAEMAYKDISRKKVHVHENFAYEHINLCL
jgi:hypothetical protein